MKERGTYYDSMDGNNLPDSLRVNPFIVPDNYFDEQTNRLLFVAKLDRTIKDQYAGFEVPSGYFNEMNNQILNQTRIDQLHKQNSFSVPENYFANQTDQIMHQISIEKLQKEQFSVPQGYFEDLTGNILAEIRLQGMKENTMDGGFSIPEKYFDNSADQILASIHLDSLNNTAKNSTFSVPSDYFENLTNSILEKTVDEIIKSIPNDTPVRKLQTKKYTAWIGAAAAACIAAFVGVSVINSENELNQTDATLTTRSVSLDNIPEDEIISYLASHTDGSDLHYYAEYIYEPDDSKGIGSQIDDKDLEEYLNSTL